MASRYINAAVSTLAILLAVLLVAMEIRHVRREWEQAKLDGAYISPTRLAVDTDFDR